MKKTQKKQPEKQPKGKAVDVVPDQSVGSLVASGPDDMIKLAISNGSDLDKLEKLLILRERYEATEAKKAFNSCMVEVHSRIPLVAKSLNNEQTHSKYASLDNIICRTRDIYTGEGFSIPFYEGSTEKEGYIRICADVIHRLGHKETYHYDVPMDGKGIKGNVNMTPIHAKASSTSYARRYLMCMIWNIPTGDDNDGNGPVEPQKEKVRMPKTSGDKQNNGVTEGEIVDPGDSGQTSGKKETLVVEQPGVIPNQLAKDLVKLAKKNGYTQAEVYEVISKLKYAKVIDILSQDYITIVKEFEVKAVDWRKVKAEIEKEWNES